jgi:glycosyltransferase involved in cell wall biosynthesis
MKMTFVTHSMYPESIGGREKYVYYLADALGKKGHEVKVFTCTPTLHSRVKKYDNFTVYYFPSFDIPLKGAKYRLPIGMLPYLLTDKSDVIHAQNLHHFTTVVSAFVAKIKNRPLVITEHGYSSMEGLMKIIIRTYEKTFVKFIGKSSNQVIGVSDFISNELKERYKISPEKIVTVHNAVEENNFSDMNNQFKEKYSLQNKRVILGVGRLTKEKGFQYLIMAFKKISEEFPDTILVIIGPKSSYKMILDKLVKRLELTEKVLFTGPLEDEMVKSAIKSCEMIVIPSKYEPFPFVALEALSYEKPAIASSVGGLPEIFTHGVNGLLVKPEDVEDLEEKIKILLTDENVKANIIKNSKESLQRFTWKSFIEKMENIYEKALAH